jgi:hypothetical protein
MEGYWKTADLVSKYWRNEDVCSVDYRSKSEAETNGSWTFMVYQSHLLMADWRKADGSLLGFEEQPVAGIDAFSTWVSRYGQFVAAETKFGIFAVFSRSDDPSSLLTAVELLHRTLSVVESGNVVYLPSSGTSVSQISYVHRGLALRSEYPLLERAR